MLPDRILQQYLLAIKTSEDTVRMFYFNKR